jgi:hypothetical protein
MLKFKIEGMTFEDLENTVEAYQTTMSKKVEAIRINPLDRAGLEREWSSKYATPFIGVGAIPLVVDPSVEEGVFYIE